MHDSLLHPPAHRGPLIAAGALVLSVGVALQQARSFETTPAQLAITAALAVVLLWLGLQGPRTAVAPHPHESVLIVLGLLAAAASLARLADLLADLAPLPSGTLVWTSLLEGALATWIAVRRHSAIATLVAAVAGGAALVFAWDWVFDPDGVTPFRWLLLLLAFVYGLASLPLRGESQRHSDQMVNAAALATFAIAAVSVFDLPGFWQFVLLVAGASSVAYAAADRAAGAAYLGTANLAAFVASADTTDTLLWWPLILMAIGTVAVLAGLRPRRPLPPEPERDDVPLTIRARR